MKTITILLCAWVLAGCSSVSAADEKPWYLIVPPLRENQPDVSADRARWLLDAAYPGRDECFKSLLGWREIEKNDEAMRRRVAADASATRRVISFVLTQAERPNDFLLREKRDEIADVALRVNLARFLPQIMGAPLADEDRAFFKTHDQILDIQAKEFLRQSSFFTQHARGECLPAHMIPDTVVPESAVKK